MSQSAAVDVVGIAAAEVPAGSGLCWARRGSGFGCCGCGSHRGVAVEIETIGAAAGLLGRAAAGHGALGISVRGGSASVFELVVAVCEC